MGFEAGGPRRFLWIKGQLGGGAGAAKTKEQSRKEGLAPGRSGRGVGKKGMEPRDHDLMGQRAVQLLWYLGSQRFTRFWSKTSPLTAK